MYLSASQLSCLNRCLREWVFRKILKYPEEKTEALIIGGLFHRLCEGKTIEEKDMSGLKSGFPWQRYFSTMLAGYKLERAKYPAETAGCEIEWEDEQVKMYIDELAVRPDGRWYMAERKTASAQDQNRRKMLARDMQTGLYVSRRHQIAEKFWLDPGKFAGVLYFITLKPMERLKKGESLEEFGERFTSSTDSWEIPAATILQYQGMVIRSLSYGEKQREIASESFLQNNRIEDVPCNTASCIRFGKPCPYFKNCHPEG